MEVQLKATPKAPFIPVKISITIETEEELQAIRALGGSANAQGTGIVCFERQYGEHTMLRDIALKCIMALNHKCVQVLEGRGIKPTMPRF